MERKKYMGTYYSTDNVLYKITELIAKGYIEEDIFAVTYEQDNVSMLQGETSVEISGTSTGHWVDRFKMFLSGDEPIFHAFLKIGLTEEETKKYFDEVKRWMRWIAKPKSIDMNNH